MHQQLLETLKKAPSTGRFLLALSGGMDSMALLHAMVSIRAQLEQRQLIAVHVNHQLQAQASDWVNICQTVCESYRVEFIALTVNVTSGAGPEASARAARYRAIESIMQPDDVVLSAHHLDDQAETLLLNLLRGSGLRGLAGMPLLRRLGTGWLMRPLLGVSRAQLLDYANSHQLQWVNDPSNQNESLDRNFLRHSVLPLLQQRWPAARQSLAVSAELLQQADEVIEHQVNQTLATITNSAGSLSVIGLQQQSSALQPLLLRSWCRERGLPALPRAQLMDLLKQLQSDEDRQPALHREKQFIGRYNGWLITHAQLPSHDPNWKKEWDGSGALLLPSELGVFVSQQGYFKTDLQVGFRQGGETMLYQGLHRDLKTLFQKLEIPAWLRDRIPLLYQNKRLIGIASLLIADDYKHIELYWQQGCGWPKF